MTTLKIDNINDSLELDQEATAELQGGMIALPLYAGSLLASIHESVRIQEISLAGVHYNNVADNGSIANSTGNSFMSVIGSANVNVLGA